MGWQNMAALRTPDDNGLYWAGLVVLEIQGLQPRRLRIVPRGYEWPRPNFYRPNVSSLIGKIPKESWDVT